MTNSTILRVLALIHDARKLSAQKDHCSTEEFTQSIQALEHSLAELSLNDPEITAEMNYL